MEAMSDSALMTLESAQKLYLRTGQHPAALELAERGLQFETFDFIYETAESFDEVYSLIANRIIEEAREGDITYAVPGHPLIAERSVALILELAKKDGIQVGFASGSQSFIEACLEALAVPIGKGLKLIDALALDDVHPSPDCPNLIYQVYDRAVASSVKLILMDVYPDESPVYVISGAGGPETTVEKLPLYELDRREHDHLTSVYVPELIAER
jgi:tetrapyrrole methylase family protein/MazG family protein